jgi:CheY-like chemotaxis protein
MFKKFRKPQPKIFMVEDNTSNYPLFTKAFKAAGFTVTICPYVDKKFFDDVAEIQPDIISMDIMIEGKGVDLPHDGLSVIGLIKADARTRNIPIMVLTNFFEEDKVERAKNEGAIDFINLQGNSISAIPKIFKRYLKDPSKYRPVHPAFQ